MKLPYALRFALGTCCCVTALWGCAEGTREREDDVQTRDNPFPTQLTFTRGSLPVASELPSPAHPFRPREPSLALDAGLSDVVDVADAATPVDAADATAHPGPPVDAGHGHP